VFVTNNAERMESAAAKAAISRLEEIAKYQDKSKRNSARFAFARANDLR